MMVCEDCGRAYNDFYGADDFYNEDECRACGGALVEAVECPMCGEWAPRSQELCNTCYESIKTVESAILAGESTKEFIDVNSFALFVLGESGVRDAVLDALKNIDEDELQKWVIDYIMDGDPVAIAEEVRKVKENG